MDYLPFAEICYHAGVGTAPANAALRFFNGQLRYHYTGSLELTSRTNEFIQ